MSNPTTPPPPTPDPSASARRWAAILPEFRRIVIDRTHDGVIRGVLADAPALLARLEEAEAKVAALEARLAKVAPVVEAAGRWWDAEIRREVLKGEADLIDAAALRAAQTKRESGEGRA